ncbi:MAG: hypothetical protein LUH21_04140 [Clostridiales bacterium]|nr:hypothetical protein [Clostridiales bacterium]
MTDTEKLILEKLDELSKDLKEVKERTTRIEERSTRIEERTTRIEDRTTRIEITMENDISKKIDIIGEGHDFLKERLGDALQMEKKRESMELELINLRMEIKKIKEHLDIA